MVIFYMNSDSTTVSVKNTPNILKIALYEDLFPGTKVVRNNRCIF